MKIREVKEIINKLKVETSSIQDFIDLDSQCVQELTSLPQEYSQVIFEYAQELLNNLEIDENNYDGYYFQVLIEGLLFREEKKLAFLLASQALMSPVAEDDNRYVSFLIDTDLPETIPMLLKGLELIESFDEYGGHAQEKAIEYLMAKGIEEAYPVIEKCLFDEADRVRTTALQFIRKFDKKESAPHLIKMLEEEEVQYNILLILDLFKKWNTTEALPNLKTYIKEDWVYEAPTLLDAFTSAIQVLSN